MNKGKILLAFAMLSIVLTAYMELSSSIHISLLTSSPGKHQSAASFGEHVFFVTDKRDKVYVYNIQTKHNDYIINLTGAEAKDYTNNTALYHCNQCSFGLFYVPNDIFPLLYISQRAKSDLRCFTEVYRIIKHDDITISGSSYSLQLVQTIFFPAMSAANSMGNVNVVIYPPQYKTYNQLTA